MLQCAEQAPSHSSITPVTSLDGHSPVHPSPSVHPTTEEDNSESGIGEIEDYDCDQLEGSNEDKTYKPEFMKMNDSSLLIIVESHPNVYDNQMSSAIVIHSELEY